MQVEAPEGIYQRMIAAYREPERAKGSEFMPNVIASVIHGVAAALNEHITLGRA